MTQFNQHDPETEEATAEPRVRVAAIIIQDEEILMVRQSKHGDTYWLLPGGGVAWGESLEEALIREVHEETGFRIEPNELVIANDTIAPDGSKHVINLYFTARIVGGRLLDEYEERIDETTFIPLSAMATVHLRPDIRGALRHAITEAFPNKAAYLGRIWK